MSRTVILTLALLLYLGASAPSLHDGPSAQAPFDGASWQQVYSRAGWDGRSRLDLRAVGDVMLGRTIAERARVDGVNYPFTVVGAAGVAPLLDGDMVLGNLESPLTARTGELRPGPYRLPAPPGFGPALSAAGFTAMSLANNHALDAGPAGLNDAHATLSAAAILPLGAGASPAAARAPRLLTHNGLDIALLAFNAVRDPADLPDEGKGWGRAWLDSTAEAAVSAAAADLVIVLVHWGNEYQATPDDFQRKWAARLVAAGADLVLGAHPHVLQPVEWLQAGGREGVVAYSLGNFVFDQEGRFETSTGVVLRVLVDEQGLAAMAVAPVDSLAGRVYPLPPHSAEGRAILRAVGVGLNSNEGPLAPHPYLRAWRWDGEAAVPTSVPRRAARAVQPDQLLADLSGDGEPLWVRLDGAGQVTVSSLDAPDTVLWRNEAADWRITRIVAGDPNNDGRVEVLLLLWRPDEQGVLRSHPFLLGVRGGRLRIIWGGSPTAPATQDLAVGDLDGDGADEVVLLQGGSRPGDPGSHIAVLTWRSWIFIQRWASPIGAANALSLQDLDGDGGLDIVVE